MGIGNSPDGDCYSCRLACRIDGAAVSRKGSQRRDYITMDSSVSVCTSNKSRVFGCFTTLRSFVEIQYGGRATDYYIIPQIVTTICVKCPRTIPRGDRMHCSGDLSTPPPPPIIPFLNQFMSGWVGSTRGHLINRIHPFIFLPLEQRPVCIFSYTINVDINCGSRVQMRCIARRHQLNQRFIDVVCRATSFHNHISSRHCSHPSVRQPIPSLHITGSRDFRW